MLDPLLGNFAELILIGTLLRKYCRTFEGYFFHDFPR